MQALTHLLLLCCVLVGVNCFEPRIVGGRQVQNREDFAYQVSLRFSKMHFCGGVILDSRNVLTAAHCVYNLPTLKYLEVFVGDLNVRSISNNTVSVRVTNATIHEHFEDRLLLNDICILKLEKDLEFSSTVKSVPLWTLNDTFEDDLRCNVSGWGTTEYKGNSSNNLLYLELPLIERKNCSKYYGNAIDPGMVCAGFEEAGRDSCEGDSGGPLVCENKLMGLVSWGFQCARAMHPGVYTDVREYSDWIKKHQHSSTSKHLGFSWLMVLLIALLEL